VLVFIDESGHPRPRDSVERPVILAVCIKESDTARLGRAIFGMERNLLGKMSLDKAEQEGKATTFLNRRALTRHAAKREFAESFFELLRDFDLAVFAVVMERPDTDPYSGAGLLQAQYRWLLERIDRYMEDEHPKHMALPIFDALDPKQTRTFSDCFGAFMARSQAGRAMQHVVPMPLFVDSALTPGIQIADRFAYVIRLYYEHSLSQTHGLSDPYFRTVQRYAQIVRSKTRDYEHEDGYTHFGIATMDKAKFDYKLPERWERGIQEVVTPSEGEG
jgi:hypothetical protein